MSSKKRRRYGSEFKKEAVQLYRKSGKSSRQIETELGIPQGLVARWAREIKTDSANAFRGNGKMLPDEATIHRLKRELEHTKRERDILKKAVAIFSKEPNRYLDL
jgi:transposase